MDFKLKNSAMNVQKSQNHKNLRFRVSVLWASKKPLEVKGLDLIIFLQLELKIEVLRNKRNPKVEVLRK